MTYKRIITFLFLLQFVMPQVVHANVVISEIMYKPNPNSGHEWVEIKNDGSQAIDFTYSISKHWKISENTTGGGIKPFKGGNTLPAQGVAVLAIDPNTFLADWPSWDGILFDITSITSLTDDKGVLSIKNLDGVVEDTVDYGTYASSKVAYNADKNATQMSLQKDSSGNWIAGSPSPGTIVGSNNVVDSNPALLADESTQGPTSTTTISDTTSVGPTSNWPVEPQVFANAGKDKVAVVGATTVFEGKALGLKKEPLENARYIWNFGDGAVGEGVSVEHTYRYPGDYLVVMEVASGYFSGIDQLKVHALPSPLSVSAITDGSGYFVELSNTSKTDIDISQWELVLNNKIFVIPKNTFVMAGKKLVFSNEVTGFSVTESSVPELHYPNGVLASRFGEVNNNIAKTPFYTPQKSEQQIIGVMAEPVKEEVQNKNTTKTPAVEDNSLSKENMATAIEGLPKKSSTNYIWFLGVAGISVLAIGGVLFARRLEQPEDEFKKIADDIEIVEG